MEDNLPRRHSHRRGVSGIVVQNTTKRKGKMVYHLVDGHRAPSSQPAQTAEWPVAQLVQQIRNVGKLPPSLQSRKT